MFHGAQKRLGLGAIRYQRGPGCTQNEVCRIRAVAKPDTWVLPNNSYELRRLLHPMLAGDSGVECERSSQDGIALAEYRFPFSDRRGG